MPGWRSSSPALILNYLGQGALLLHNPSAADNPFYRLVPEWGQLPMVFLATIATIIASQAVISGAFSLTRQAVQLGLLPRVTIRHTSKSMEGQIYIPFINWALLIAVIGLVLGFGSSSHLASAYGIAVTGTFATTTILAFVVFRKLWHKPLWIVIPGAAFFLTIELTFFAANMTKIGSGGWLPLVVGLSVFTVLTTWRKGQRLVAHRMREGRIPIRRYINRLIEEPVLRVPGTAVYLTVTGDATPPALMTNVAANRVLPETVVLFTATTEGVPYVDDDKRFAIESLRLGFIRVQARYGFQERPDVFAALRRARDAGFQVDVETPAFILSHVSLVPAVNQHSLPRWRRWLFVLLQRNSTPAAQYFNLPPQMVFEVGARRSKSEAHRAWSVVASIPGGLSSPPIISGRSEMTPWPGGARGAVGVPAFPSAMRDATEIIDYAKDRERHDAVLRVVASRSSPAIGTGRPGRGLPASRTGGHLVRGNGRRDPVSRPSLGDRHDAVTPPYVRRASADWGITPDLGASPLRIRR